MWGGVWHVLVQWCGVRYGVVYAEVFGAWCNDRELCGTIGVRDMVKVDACAAAFFALVLVPVLGANVQSMLGFVLELWEQLRFGVRKWYANTWVFSVGGGERWWRARLYQCLRLYLCIFHLFNSAILIATTVRLHQIYPEGGG